jgi:hypothetical protein
MWPTPYPLTKRSRTPACEAAAFQQTSKRFVEWFAAVQTADELSDHPEYRPANRPLCYLRIHSQLACQELQN